MGLSGSWHSSVSPWRALSVGTLLVSKHAGTPEGHSRGGKASATGFDEAQELRGTLLTQRPIKGLSPAVLVDSHRLGNGRPGWHAPFPPVLWTDAPLPVARLALVKDDVPHGHEGVWFELLGRWLQRHD
jgi:hypothetical protein